ncbi:MAG: T9SS type A sorting domain-containing protein [Bacteroidota bacterium]
MKKSTLLILSVIICIPLFSQWSGQVPAIKMDMKKRTPVLKNDTREKQSRAPGDTLYLFDFSNPANWTTWHNGSSIDWVIENSANAGGTTLGDALSGNNIAVPPQAVFDAYYYLSNSIVPPVYDGYLEYTGPMLDFTAHSSVFIKWHQWHWAFNYDHCNLEITTDDGATWTMFNDLFAGYGVCSSIPAYQTVNLSSICGGQDSVRFRFSYYCDNTDVNYGGGYGWILDDVAFVEGAVNDITIDQIVPSFLWSIPEMITYRQIPGNIYTDTAGYGNFYLDAIPMRIFFGADIINNSGGNATNIDLNINVTDAFQSVSYFSCSALQTIGSLAPAGLGNLGCDTLSSFDFNGFSGTGNPELYPGDYNIRFTASFDSLDQNPADNTEDFNFTISDTVYAVDNNPINPATVTPAQWASGGMNGDLIAVYYPVTIGAVKATSISVYINDNTNGSAIIRGVLYVYDGSGGYAAVIETDVYQVDSTMGGQWLLMPFMTDGFSEYIPESEYYAGIQFLNYLGGDVYLGEDAESPQSIYTTLWFFTNAGQWYFLTNYNSSPMIRLNIWGDDFTGYETGEIINQSAPIIYPNPFSDNSSLCFDLPVAAEVRIEISDIAGKTINIVDAGKLEAGRNQIQISSEGMEDGIYYYSLYAGGMKASGKMVVIR